MDPNKCDQEVFEKGISLGFFDMTKEEANRYCIDRAEETGHRYDWHYAGGRVHMKYLPKGE